MEKVKALKSYKTVCTYLNKFNGVFGDMVVADIRPADLENLQAKRLKQGFKEKTIDDEINYIKTAVIKAFDNDKISGDALRPFRRVKKLLKGHANARDRLVTQYEFNNLVEHCPRHLMDILTTAYWTGMRKGEIKILTWDRVDLKGRIIRLEATDTKEGKAKSIPMAQAVYDTFKAIPRALHDSHVMSWPEPHEPEGAP